ncbi:MAG: right-handed parallel beta-helix repeat-containing protein [Sedimentisphaerales bacterium]|nr:right-handed parallel beta-helix repeat-containing protein [Sedimentisphaerales bacterium]
MKLARTGWSWITAAVVVSIAVCLVPAQVNAWTFEYRDDFSTTKKIEKDGYLHSMLWPRGAFPPSEPYLYHSDTYELGFGEYDEAALLGYRFPFGSTTSPGAVSGYLNIDVRFTDSSSGYLQYEVSEDGIDWSSGHLGQGSQNISLESVSGECYVRFIGNEVLIDNLEIFLSSSSATIGVPGNFATIQDAIDSASYGDIIEVSPGTYTGQGNWDIDFKGKAITVRSSSGSSRTTIDCSGAQGHRGFYFHRGEGRKSVLRGFTIRGASLTGSDIPSDNSSWNSSHPIGGGIYCENSGPSIFDCVIERCKAEVGSGIGVVSGSPLIFGCTVERCEAGGFGTAQTGGYGAGIAIIKGSDARIVNSVIESNTAYNDSLGAGVYCWRSEVMLSGCEISFNEAQVDVEGGGLYCGGSSAQAILENCIISHNTAETGGGVFSESNARINVTNCTVADNIGEGVYADSSYVAIKNSIIWYNSEALSLRNLLSSSPVVYSDIQGSYSGQGNISSEPMFVSNGSDYHLRSYWDRELNADHSPCIDAGDPQDPVGAEPFPNNKRINMGAYGGTHEASKSFGPVIFHVDGTGGNDYNEGMSRDDAFRTIQEAVDRSGHGDIIMVWPGIYRESVFVEGRSVTIQSADDAAVVIAPFDDPIAFTFQFAESSRSVLRNFIIADCGDKAILCHGASPELTNLTIVNNQFGIAAYAGAAPSITNCIFWNNGDQGISDLEQCRARYSRLGILEPDDGNRGNISEDPRFAGAEDFHLQSEYGRYVPSNRSWTTDSLTSPCIDGGDPAMRVGREQKPNGAQVNMGAYGGTPFASKSGPSW